MRKRTITESQVREAWVELLAPEQPFVSGRGWTVREIIETYARCPSLAAVAESEMTIRRKVRRLVALGRVRQIGVRPTRPRAAVYEVVPPSPRANKVAH
jgi:hypothetical protein